MSRPFRFEPPELRSGALSRPRLVRALSGRWRYRVTVVVGGAGLGKTTLLAQVLAENRMAPRGDDVWVGVEPEDADGVSLACGVAAAIASPEAGVGVSDLGPDAWRGSELSLVADAFWRRSPIEVCLVLDDVHLLPRGSAGAEWLDALIDALPTNGHVVLATRRSELPVRLARLEAQGEVLRLGESDLRFCDEESTRFAAGRGLEPGWLDATGGWPALAELTATVGRDMAGTYLWEEVLGPVGPERRRVLAVLCDLGGGDDDLMSAVLERRVDLGEALEGVPLVDRGADGWHVPHALWDSADGVRLDPDERAVLRHRAVVHLSDRGRFDVAFGLLRGAALWELAPGVLRAAALASGSHRARRLGQWLSASPEVVRASPAGRLAIALQAAFSAPAEAVEPLRAAAIACREAGDVDAELCAIAQLGRLGWFRQDASVLGPELGIRVLELAGTGHPHAQALAAFGRAMIADMAGDDATVLSELAGIETGVLDPAWEVMASWLYGVVRLGLGDAEAVCDLVERLATTSDPALRTVLDGLRLRAWWALGRVEDVLSEAPSKLDAIRTGGVASNRHLVLTNTSVLFSHTGDLTEARRCLDEGTAAAPPRPARGQHVRTALATASLQLAEGHEDDAAVTLRAAIESHGLDRGIDRRGWRHLLALSYVLVPETRHHWDGLELRGYLRTARRLASGVVAAREGYGQALLRNLDLPEIGMVRSSLPFPLAAELAIGLVSVGRAEGPVLLEALGAAGRGAVRTMATAPPSRAKPAKALLAALPAPPPHGIHLAALGPLALRRDSARGDEIAHHDLRRRRVRELLAFLVTHRRTTRAAINAALWPDLRESLPGNNLSVTLNHLLRALEPWRHPGEAAYLVRLDGPNVRLVTGEHLRIDLDDFDLHIAAAGRADVDGIPSLALEHQLAAVALYQGDLCSDLTDTPWAALDREHYRSRFVTAATRAAQLLVGQGDTDRAERVARRALTVDPWAEDAHTALVGAALARGDRSAARRSLDTCLHALAELGIQPSPATRQLQRRVHSDAQPAGQHHTDSRHRQRHPVPRSSHR